MQTTNTFVQNITVLTAIGRKTVKSYSLDKNRQLLCIPYDHEKYFNYRLEPTHNIEQLSTLLTALSNQQNVILIRGIPVDGLPKPAVRNHENFPEGDEGRSWAMLDFDNIPLPEGIDPTSRSAVEYIVKQLPSEFHNTSHFFQFSSSAGILKPDGTTLKAGLNVHLFFWFERPIHGKKLSAYFESHCYKTGFYEKTLDSGGSPRIRLGIDLSLLREVQPHYVGLPIVGAGVTCTLALADRQGLVKKRSNSVLLPDMEASLIPDTISTRMRLLNAWKTECGFVPARITTRAAHGGISISTYYRKPNGPSPSSNRIFIDAKLYGEKQDAVILFFDGEFSPGSFFVKQSSPQLTLRFGDYGSIPLKELSEGAYAYVRDELKWFSEIAHVELSLNDAGFVPDIRTFCTARNALIESPTGSGKTQAFCRYAETCNGVIFYVAQTIALVNQTYNDLRNWNRGEDHSPSKKYISATYYGDFHKGSNIVSRMVYVTTIKSLPKFIAAAADQGINFELIIDEIHVALDDFMKSNAANELLERAISRASRTIFMTGTITNLQVTKLLDTISRACGTLTAQVYTGYKFHPIKSNPLYLVPVANFGADFVALLARYKKLKEEGRPVPRTIVITSSTKMRKFEFILAEFGLLEDAMVVSRQESSPAMIEEARISTLPILVSSPLFALGINFVVPPVVLWTYFSYLHVDESQIIQTLNRANRGSVRCEVRLYHGELDTTPVSIPDAEKEKMRIAGYLLDEATMQGVLDAHYQIDRVTYLSLREAEKQTPKSFYSLIERDGFQNYQIHYEWVNDIETTKEDDDLFDDIARGARESYLNDVEVQALRYSNHTYSLLLYQLERLYQEKKQWADEERILRDIENKQRGVCMLICGVSPKVSANVKPARLRRLFADLQPYMTAQYSHEKTGEWRTVAAEKTLAMIPLLEHLKRMKADNLGGITFAALMNRPMRGAVKALADNEDNLISWQKKLERLDAIAFQIRNSASKAQRPHLNAERFEIAEEFLATIGVTFEKVKDWDTGRLVTDPSQPKVPNWDFEAMIVELQRAAESLKRLPEKPVDKNWENEHWFGAAVSHQLCALCVHCDPDYICALGRPIQPVWDDIGPTTDKCDAFHKLPAKLIPKEPTKN